MATYLDRILAAHRAAAGQDRRKPDHLVEAARRRARSPARTSSAVDVLINLLALLHVVHVERDLTYCVGEPVSEAVPSRDSRAQRDLA